MNLDFKLNMTGKLARRLAYLNSIVPLDLDPRILNHMNKDTLNVTNLQATLQGLGVKELNQKQLDVCQFVADTEYRAIIGALTVDEIMLLTLSAALSSGRSLVVISDQDSIGWETLMTQHGIDYATITDGDSPLTHPITLVTSMTALDCIKKQARDHVLVYVPHHYDFNIFDSFAYKKLVDGRPALSYTIQEMAMEFPHCVFGYYMDDNVTPERIKLWPSDKRMINMINAINCNPKIHKTLDGTLGTKQTLDKMGFTRNMPSYVGKILNVNMDLLTLSHFFEKPNDHSE